MCASALCIGALAPVAAADERRRGEGAELIDAIWMGGVGVNYQKSESITLAPMRAGVGLRAGANIGYLAYTRERSVVPL